MKKIYHFVKKCIFLHKKMPLFAHSTSNHGLIWGHLWGIYNTTLLPLCTVVGLFYKPAIGSQAALVAERFAGLADIASVEQEPVVRLGNEVLGDVTDELPFGLERVLAMGGEAEPFAHAEDMRVHGHGGLIIDDGTDHIGSLASHALQRLQLFNGVGHLAVIDLDEALRHSHQVFRFGAGITDGLNIREDLIGGGPGQGFRRRVGGKESRRYHVYPLVRTLRREHDRHEALEGVCEMQLTLRNRHVGLEPGQYVLKAVGCFHNMSCSGTGALVWRVAGHRRSRE